MSNQELQDILNTQGFNHVKVIDKNNVEVTVDGEPEIFSRNDIVTGNPMSGLRYYGTVFGDHRMIQGIADEMEIVFKLINQ